MDKLKNLIICVTEKCNITCPYCIVKLRHIDKRSKHYNPDMLYKIDELPENTIYKKIVFSGGEPGILKKSQIKDILYKIFKYKDKFTEFWVLTNGLFLLRHHDFFVEEWNGKINYKWHITSKKNFHSILSKIHFSDKVEYQFSIIINSVEDIDLIEYVILNMPKNIYAVINFEFSHNEYSAIKNIPKIVFDRYIKFLRDGYMQYIKYDYNFINSEYLSIFTKFIFNESVEYAAFNKYLRLSVLLIKQDIDCSCMKSYIELF